MRCRGRRELRFTAGQAFVRAEGALLPGGADRRDAAPRWSRVTSILRSPRKEWPVIASEPTTEMEIYTGYVMPLAAIGALALFIAEVTIGDAGAAHRHRQGDADRGPRRRAPRVRPRHRPAVRAGIAHRGACPQIRRRAQPRSQALKVAAYSYTPIWLAGALVLLPPLSILWPLACLYALYLAFVGLPLVMRSRQDQAIPYALMAGGAALALFLFFGGLMTALLGFGPGIFD